MHLRVRVRGQKRNDLLGGDAHPHGPPDGLARQFAGDHVRIARRETAEEGEDGDLQGRRGVGVDPVVGLDHDEAAVVVVVCRGRRDGAAAGEGGRA